MDSTTPVREVLTELARTLPSDASLEDVQYQLYVRQQVESGLADADADRMIEPDELRRRLEKHRTSRVNKQK